MRVGDARIYQARFNWKDIDRIKKLSKIPVILKGIATHEDASLAIEHGVDCVYVSNHGGRQLDQGVGSIEVLPEVVEAVKGRAKIMVDGSITRGTDVVKALILGADAVAWRPALCLWARRRRRSGGGAALRDPRGRNPHLPVAAGGYELRPAR